MVMILAPAVIGFCITNDLIYRYVFSCQQPDYFWYALNGELHFIAMGQGYYFFSPCGAQKTRDDFLGHTIMITNLEIDAVHVRCVIQWCAYFLSLIWRYCVCVVHVSSELFNFLMRQGNITHWHVMSEGKYFLIMAKRFQ